MIEGKFVARKSSADPIICRVSFDDGTGFLEVGSISQRARHTGNQDTYWHWGIDTFPLAGGNPNGETWSLEAGMQAFREAFLKWVNEMPPGTWQRNRDHIGPGGPDELGRRLCRPEPRDPRAAWKPNRAGTNKSA
jgi:hypothetical protein